MYIVLEKGTKRVVVMLPEDDDVILDENNLTSRSLTISDISSNTHDLVIGLPPEPPIYWVAGTLRYLGGVWEILDQLVYDTHLPQAREKHRKQQEEKFTYLQSEIIGAINIRRDLLLFTNITAQFPVGEKTIQFRDPGDQLALTNVVQGAMVNCMSGTPGAPTIFITEDNVVQSLRADEMVAIGMAALQQKQTIVHIARDKKNYILSLEPTSGNLTILQNYDVEAGW